MKKQLFITAIIISLGFSSYAQWTDNGNNTTTTDKVGIGTNNPITGLHLWDNVSNTTVGGNSKSVIRLSNDYTPAFHSGGELQFGVSNTSGADVLSAIKGTYSSWNSGNLGGSLIFYTRHSDGLGLKNRMHIKSNGNVGIGTSNPDQKLTVQGSVNIGGTGNSSLRVRHVNGKSATTIAHDNLYLNYGIGKDVYVGYGSSNPISNLYVYGSIRNGSSDFRIGVHDGRDQGSKTSNRALVHYLNDQLHLNYNGDFEGGMYLDGPKVVVDGNVGIGISSPTDKLHVNGNVRSNSQFVLTGIGSLNSSNTTDMKLWSVQNLVLASGSGNNHLMIQTNGDVGVGTSNTQGYKLGVKGKIAAEEVKVQVYPWSDFVFDNDYKLPTLEEVEQHIKDRGHLKDIPSSEEVAENGILLGGINAKLLQKIEELTLYTIEQEKAIKDKETKISNLEEKLHMQEQRLEIIENIIKNTKHK